MNLVFIGLPGSGKTTVGRAAAALLGMPFFDCDDQVERRAGMPIPTIFALEGECWFRHREAACLEQLLSQDGAVIATGGGAVLLEENRRALRKAKVIFLDRSVEDIMLTFEAAGRPLMAAHTLAELSRERRQLYLAAADHIIREPTAEQAAQAAARWWREELCDF